MARRCCCGASCKTTITYSSPSDWTTGTGGSVASDGSGGLDIDGPVDPSSFMTSEAYQIEFGLAGSVSFSIGGITIAADADAQTITAGANTVACGQSTKTPLGLTVRIRVTPTHICIWAIGNYDPDGNGPIGAYGILTADRSGSVPSSFTATWSSANISGFQISDATIQVASDYSLDLECWTEPTLACPYLLYKTITKNHKYQDSGGWGIGDLNMIDIAHSGYDPIADAGRTPVGDAFWGPDNPGYHETDTSPTLDYLLMFREGTDFACGPLLAKLCKWYEDFAEPTTDDYVIDESIYYTTYSLSLDWGTPSPSTPYPKPTFTASLTLGFAFIPSDSITFDVNDLLSGFTISVSETFSGNTMTTTWTFSP